MRKIKEYEASRSKTERKSEDPVRDVTTLVARHGPISIDAPIPNQMFRLRIAHTDLLGSINFMFFEHVNAFALKGFPGPTRLVQIASDALELSSDSAMARWTMALRAIRYWRGSDSYRPECLAPVLAPDHRRGSLPIAAMAEYREQPDPLHSGAAERWQVSRPLSDHENRKRTYISRNHQFELLDGMGICFRDEQTLRMISQDKNWMSEWWNKTYPSDSRSPDEGLLVRHDESTGWNMTLAWDDWTHLKSHDVYDCLHVAPRLGPLAPGRIEDNSRKDRVVPGLTWCSRRDRDAAW